MRTIKLCRQHGVIFLALVLVLFMGGATFVLGSLNNRQSASLARNAEIRYQLEQTKAQLLAYAANYATLYDNERGPGFFPCPDTDDPTLDATGAAEATCDSDLPLIGRLPKYDGNGATPFYFSDTYADVDQQFWLVVAPRYVYYSSASSRRRSYMRTLANTGVSTQASQYWLTLDGETEYVALIIAPGDELETQARTTGPTDYANYLDGQNGGDGFNFYTSYQVNPELFNDVVVGITLDEYIVYTGTAVAHAMKLVLDQYHDTFGNYPFDNSSSQDYLYTSGCGTTTGFGDAFENGSYTGTHNWLRDASFGNGNTQERWSCRYGSYWVRLAGGDSGELKFPGCTGLKFTLVHGGGITREGNGC